MKRGSVAFVSLAILVLAAFSDGSLIAQRATGSRNAPLATQNRPAAKAWVQPRTPWGDPDLQGIWLNDQDNLTPFERPAEMGQREFLTDEEYAKKAADLKDRAELKNGGTVWLERVQTPSRRTSLIVSPADGRIPPLTADAQRKYDARAEARRQSGVVSSENIGSMWSRCITRTVPGGWIPFRYNNNRQFLQIPGYVVIVYEEIHDVRIIPLDGRPHFDPKIREWMGDSRGHWEGTTLVVEISNFKDKVNFRGSTGELDDQYVSDKLKMVERFTRVDANTMDYSVTIDDPETFTKPWTIAMQMLKDDTQTQILEYACHEGNYVTMLNMLGGARAQEAEQAKKNQR